MTRKLEGNENSVAGSTDEKGAIVNNSSITSEHQSNTSNAEAVADRTTPVAPSQRDQLPAETASADGDHPHDGGNGRSNADTGQPRIEPPDNREKIPLNRECPRAVGYGRPPVAFRFRPGRSGNPGGRPRRLPVTERYAETLEMQLPPVQRRQVEQDIGMKLPKKYTFGDAQALKRNIEALNNLKAGREIREAVEGTATRRVVVLEPAQESPEELRRHIFLALIDVCIKRHQLYDMDMPELEQMAADIGVSLPESIRVRVAAQNGDEKPSPPDASIEDKKPWGEKVLKAFRPVLPIGLRFGKNVSQ